MSRSRRFVLVVSILLLGSVGVATLTVTADTANVQLSNVTVSPAEPTTGESVSIEATIENLESSTGSVTVTDVYIRAAGSAQTHERIEDIGSVDPGGSITVPLSMTFDREGEKKLTVNVITEDHHGDRQSYKHPVSVDVSDVVVDAGLSVSSAQNNSEQTTVVLTNYGNVDLSSVEITAAVDGDVVARESTFDIGPESEQSVTFDTDEIAAEEVLFTATYTAMEQEYQTTTAQRIEQSVPGEIHLSAIETTHTGTGVIIEGDAANIGGTDTQSVLLTVSDEDGVSPVSPSGEYFIGTVDASEFTTFELTAAVDSDTTTVPVEIMYIVDNERITTTQHVDIVPADSSVSSAGGQPADQQQDPDASSGSGVLSRGLLGVVAGIVIVGSIFYAWKRE